MKITRISVFQVDLPLHEGSYKWSGGKSVAVFDSTVVRIETDEGVSGHGEVCPLGPVYLPSYARGVRAGLEELAPQLIGEDPTQIERLNRTMDAALKGHPYVKSAIDMAAWDVLGQVAGMPVCELLGGRYGDDFVLYRAISQETPEAMAASVTRYREEGYRRFQLKVGGDPDVDVERIHAAATVLGRGDKLIADANTGWLRHEAMRVAAAVRDVDVYIEQPCASYEECLSVPSPHRSSLRAGRVDRRHRRTAARARGSGHGRGEHQDREARRPVPGAAGTRPLPHPRHRHDPGGHLGGDVVTAANRPSRAQHTRPNSCLPPPTSTAT